MATGKREEERQAELWLPTLDLARAPGHPSYERLNVLLAAAKFDERTEELCRSFYAESTGRPSLPPGVNCPPNSKSATARLAPTQNAPSCRRGSTSSRQHGALGFGLDSFVESSSSLVLLWRLSKEQRSAESSSEDIERLDLPGFLGHRV